MGETSSEPRPRQPPPPGDVEHALDAVAVPVLLCREDGDVQWANGFARDLLTRLGGPPVDEDSSLEDWVAPASSARALAVCLAAANGGHGDLAVTLHDRTGSAPAPRAELRARPLDDDAATAVITLVVE